MVHSIIPFIQCLRPKQWTKNVLVLAAFLFSLNKISLSAGVDAFLGFLLFCATSGVVYIVNDWFDLEKDRAHPVKKFRPMAAGRIPPNAALTFGLILLGASFAFALSKNLMFGLLLIAYFLMNVAYSAWLKHVVLLDIMIIAAGFVMRSVGGGLIIGVQLTPWFLVCTMLLALFLAVSKRRHEFISMPDKASRRKVLKLYSTQLLDQLISIVTTSTIISYSLFTFTSGSNYHMMWTIPFVMYGIFRYLYLIYMKDEGGSPEKILLEDKPMLITVLLYGLSVFVILRYLQ
ncbi:decaprenyl-phosphate phosphoribosyltransferase [Paenibacillus oceani]|uniref:Decaprenyl-phosphate phosphoribosyltransferase n=1 Tax=Paenibacillus oceani TaxID=2772510 RepID=A0A927H3B1_9BACL|nr:decaprenyl-phosphate phosphoribosyltransferase [Paenibacillus oceani]MBD2866162.1 decaprenyl-phosphate phosphoribosyltransferase [Paenibacillus oceani]